MKTTAAIPEQREFREQEAKYRSLFESIDAGFCIIDLKFDEAQRALDYRFLEVNPAFERQTGLLQAEGQWMRTLAPPHEQHWFDIYGAVALTGEPIRFENAAFALQNRWYDVYAFRIGEPSKRQVAILFNDITQRKQSDAALERAYTELQHMSEELRRSNEDLEQFVRVAGHDLRAPLSSIVQFSQLLARRPKDTSDADTQKLLGHIVESGLRMAQLLDDLLQYARLSHMPQTPLAPVWAGLGCSQATEHLYLAIKESQASIDCQIPHEVTVRIELSLLTLIFQNLIGNAIQYRREHVKPQIQVTAVAHDPFWRLAVQDNGEGIEKRFTQQIFEPFRRLHGPERPGSGIGLATCKRLVERIGGSIGVESRVGEGSTFYFLLPKA